MDKVLVLGSAGMLGHKLLQRLGKSFAVAGTIREAKAAPPLLAALNQTELFSNVSAHEFSRIEDVVDRFRPSVIINCIGVIKQRKESKDAIPSILINALLPHQLAALAQAKGIRLIHFSTDCVFSGHKGRYTESDPADAQDLYGRSKRLGEVDGANCLTIRSSIIGHELQNGLSLVDWFLSQKGKTVNGFARAIYSGLPTAVMSDLVAWLIREQSSMSGTWHVASEPISKFDLLTLIRETYGAPITINRFEDFVSDRSLDGRQFQSRTGWVAPSWPDMVQAMHQDWVQSAYIR